MKKFRVAVLANLKKNAPQIDGMPSDQWDDLDSEKTVNALVDAIQAGGHTSEFIEGNLDIIENLPKFKPDICFNLCEGHFGDAREAHIPVLLEMLRIPYTGSKVLTLGLALDKPLTKRILAYHDLPTPRFQVFERVYEPLNDDMDFPLFAKPSHEGTGMGVTGESILHNEAELRVQVGYILEHYEQTALVEQYIEGREVTIGVIGNLVGPAARRLPDDSNVTRVTAGLRFLPPMEVNLKPYEDTDVVYSNRLKVVIPEELDYFCPAPLDNEMVNELNWLTAAVFRVTGANDVSRVDFRLDAHDNWKPYILETNPLPGLTPEISDLVIEATAAGIGYTELINLILEAALYRYNMI